MDSFVNIPVGGHIAVGEHAAPQQCDKQLCLALCCWSLLSSVFSSIRLREMPVLDRDETVLDNVLDLKRLHTHTHTHRYKTQ